MSLELARLRGDVCLMLDWTEEQRLKILIRYAILDTPPEEVFDRVVRLATMHFQVPIATVTFIDKARQWFKAVHGLKVRETGRDIAFCHYTIRQDDVMVVPDASKDDRFATNPLVAGEPAIRFYAGAPIVSREGFRLGTVSVIDRRPRADLGTEDRQILRDLAATVMNELEMRLAASNYLTEIEERKRAESELKVISDRFRVALAHSPVVLFSQDRELRYTWAANVPAPLTPEHLLGQTDHDLWSGDAGMQIMQAKQEVLETGRPVRRDLSLMLNDELRTFDTSIEPVTDERGKITGLTAAAVDVSDQRRAKDNLKRALTEAERASRAKARFLAAAGHDLRQPFQAMVLFCEVLSTTSLDERQRASLEGLREAIAIGQTLLSALLDISTLDAGIVQPKIDTVSLTKTLANLVEEARMAASARGLSFRYVPSSAVVSTDPILLCRMVRNLVMNSVKYTVDGRVLLGCRRLAAGVRLEVCDTGPGVPPDELEDIFEEFYQGSNPERDRSKGLGLGLAIVKRTAALLGHRIGVRSRPGRGTCFTIELAYGQG